MYAVSNTFKQYLAQPSREFETKVVVGAVTYDNSSILEFDIEDSVIPSEEFTLGAVITSRLTISIRTSDTIADNSSMSPFVRLNGTSGWSEWVPLGSYYVDSRTYQNDVWKFTCYDRLILSQQVYVSTLVYPNTMQNVFDEICSRLGTTKDSSVVIDPSYTIPYKNLDISMRDMLGYIACAHASSLKMTKDGKVSFVKFTPSATLTPITASDYFKINETNPQKTYTAIKLTYNTDGEELTSGSGDSDHTLSIYNPFMTQGILDNVMSEIDGLSYTPFTMDWKGMPNLEVGDAILVTRRDGTTFSSMILTNKASYKGGLKTTSTAPSLSAQRSETDFKGSLSTKVESLSKNSLQTDGIYYGVSIGKLNGIKVESSNGVTETIINSDSWKISKNNEPVFYVDNDGDLNLAGVITLQDLKDSEGNSLLTEDKQSLAGGRIGSGTISADKLVARTINAASGVIDTAAINTAHIQNAAVTSAKIAFEAVGTSQIAVGCITTALIEEGAIGNAQIADASIDDAKIVSMTANKITSGTIDAGEINVINLHAANITVGTINGEQLSQGAINTGNIASGAITQDLIAVGAITAEAIVNGTITGSKLALGTIAANHLNVSNHMLY